MSVRTDSPASEGLHVADSPMTARDGNLTRRDFMAAVAAIAPVAACAATSVAAAPTKDYDVIVIGGGFCGITAARECRKAGYRTLVLEARNRLGGRTFTTNVSGQLIDLGGMWVHWSQPYVWTEIKRSGVALTESLGASADKIIVRTRRNRIVTLSSVSFNAQFERALAQYMGSSRTLLPLPHDPFGSDEYLKVDQISSAERLSSLTRVDDVCRDYLDGFLASSGHNSNDQFAWLEMVRWYALPGHNPTDMSDSVGRFHFASGSVSLLNALVAEGNPDIRLGTPVRRVVQEGSRVTIVTSAGEELNARAVISTIPLNVLKDVDWQPSLSEGRMQASRETHAGGGTKAHVVIEGNHGNVACAAPDLYPLNWLATEEIHEGNTHLIGFGADAKQVDVNDTDSVEKAVRLFIPSAKVLSTIGYEWNLDPYSKGTWCTLRPGMWSKYLRDLQKESGRIVFASADWANGWRGFIDGAIEQGLSAGARIKAMLA